MEFLHGLKDGFTFYGWGFVFGAGVFASILWFCIIFVLKLIISIFDR